MHLRNTKNLVGGLGLVAIAVVFWLQMGSLPLLRGTSLGSGGLPKLSAAVLALFGIWFCYRAFVDAADEAQGPLALRGMAAIGVAVLVFAFGLETFGLFATGAAATFIAGLAATDCKAWELVTFPFILSGLCVLIFVKLLGISAPIWPMF
ncbi:tripartite tricarboxylate transporter TctB family protein [Ancylobacter sp. WKF20]|uniref:tripartite tricarboxylate transporter TctB family protein n=1 Tax=Ancylobacter sp. WKF20 TaxID=3039801 RepID=UPI0024345628|nr:tripartite tricarboxylate transporter TctB family protein [Ancylobacter sp. WKF20]WGD29657.1 tripartite tricarboxylate transporter TctB family protein [Ancylobacter sp. WKF20]